MNRPNILWAIYGITAQQLPSAAKASGASRTGSLPCWLGPLCAGSLPYWRSCRWARRIVRRPAYRAPSVSLVRGKEALALNRLHRKLNVRKRRAPSNAAIGRERRIALLGLLEPGRSECVSLVRYVYV